MIDSIEWMASAVQRVVHNQIRVWNTKLHRNGVSYADLRQELAIVFLRAKERFTGEPTLDRFLSFLTACCHRRLIDLHRKNHWLGRDRECCVADVYTASAFEDKNPLDVLFSSPERHDGNVDVTKAHKDVQKFVMELEVHGLQTTDESGDFQPVAQFCRRVTNRPWSSVRPLLYRWAKKHLLPVSSA